MLSEIAADEFASALDACAAAVLWEAGIESPPVDAAVVAARIGLEVARNDALDVRGRFVRLTDRRKGLEGQGTIVVGPAERPERLQWAIAHEIGESVAYRVYAALGLEPDAEPEGREVVANHLASCLLLPRDWFATAGHQCRWDMFALKQRFPTTSHELIARRMLEMPPPIVMTLCDHGTVRWRRTNAGSRPPRMLPDELSVWQAAHKSGKVASSTSDPEATGLDSVCAWPIHEIGWKREILRSEIVEW